MRAVDALGAMDDAADNLESARMHSGTLRKARAAVAELVEADREYDAAKEAFAAIGWEGVEGADYAEPALNRWNAAANRRAAALARIGPLP